MINYSAAEEKTFKLDGAREPHRYCDAYVLKLDQR